MYPIPIMVGVDGSKNVGFDLLPKSDSRIQEGMRSYVQTYPTQIFVCELLMPEVTGIQVQNVVVYLARLFDILIFNAVLNDVCDVVG
jgi:hypothetical protein